MTEPTNERLALIASGIADRLNAGASGAPDLDRDIAKAITELISLRQSHSTGAVVKGLEWERTDSGYDYAKTPFAGDYYSVWTEGSAARGCWSKMQNGINRVDGGREEAKDAAQADYESRILSALYTHPKEAEVTVTEDVIRPEIKSEQVILERLAAGDEIAYSQDGDDAFFTKGDRAFVGKVIISMRSKGYLKRIVLDDENYRGGAERDVISDAGRATLDLVAALSRKG